MKKTYQFEIVETLARVVEIEAESREKAEQEVRNQYYDLLIELTSDDFFSTDFIYMSGDEE